MKNFFKQFGGKITADDRARYQKSPNWREGKFQNLEPTDFSASLWRIPGIIYKQMTRRKGREPRKSLPVQPFDKQVFQEGNHGAEIIWYGHSALFMRLKGLNILIDPMLAFNTTPIAPFKTKRFAEHTLELIDQFPEIDLILLTHDHYDHLDFASIQKLKGKTKRYYVALGLKRHLVRWGVEAALITECDWWDEHEIGDIRITFTPTRHFSGRGLRDRMKCLWGGWAFHTAEEAIWFSGDGGYGAHFAEIGKRLGPFDFGFMECGQYNHDWHPIHLFPDEAVQAALDAGVRKAMPVHWGGFALSYQHTWKEPVEEFVAAAKAADLDFATPPMGKLFTVNATEKDAWWAAFE
ncbi:MAG: MBL fold metallo-hydrolase [Bacteroidota bacterium]